MSKAILAASEARKVQGLMTDMELLSLATVLEGAGVVLEIGCYKGRSTTAIALAGNTVLSVDDFSLRWVSEPAARQEQERHDTKEEFRRTVRRLDGRAVHIQADSFLQTKRLEGALRMLFPDGIGGAFIDASHDYESVAEDIRLCKAVVRVGGIICGHDWTLEGVRRAAEEAFAGPGRIMLPVRSGPDNKMWWAKNE